MRRKPDQEADLHAPPSRGRSRGRRRRSVARGSLRIVFLGLVLAGVFVLGLGYGRTLSGQDELRKDEVTVTYEAAPIEATLPTRTVTVTKTVTVKTTPRARSARTTASG